MNKLVVRQLDMFMNLPVIELLFDKASGVGNNADHLISLKVNE